eukprot:SAG22_NODE_13206_length_414_cov_2.053968_1_plen_50_part_10
MHRLHAALEIRHFSVEVTEHMIIVKKNTKAGQIAIILFHNFHTFFKMALT